MISQPIPDIIVFTETWLKEGPLNLGLFEFDVHREDRNMFDNPSTWVGGIMTSTKKNHWKRCSMHWMTSSWKCIVFAFVLSNKYDIFIAFYLSPVSTTLTNVALLTNFNSLRKYAPPTIESSISTKNRMVVLGDSNLNRINWKYTYVFIW